MQSQGMYFLPCLIYSWSTDNILFLDVVSDISKTHVEHVELHMVVGKWRRVEMSKKVVMTTLIQKWVYKGEHIDETQYITPWGMKAILDMSCLQTPAGISMQRTRKQNLICGEVTQYNCTVLQPLIVLKLSSQKN